MLYSTSSCGIHCMWCTLWLKHALFNIFLWNTLHVMYFVVETCSIQHLLVECIACDVLSGWNMHYSTSFCGIHCMWCTLWLKHALFNIFLWNTLHVMYFVVETCSIQHLLVEYIACDVLCGWNMHYSTSSCGIHCMWCTLWLKHALFNIFLWNTLHVMYFVVETCSIQHLLVEYIACDVLCGWNMLYSTSSCGIHCMWCTLWLKHALFNIFLWNTLHVMYFVVETCSIQQLLVEYIACDVLCGWNMLYSTSSCGIHCM